MGQKVSGIEKLLAPSLNRIEEELKVIHAEMNTAKAKIDEISNSMTKVEDDNRHLSNRLDNIGSGLPTDVRVSIDNINDMEKHDRDEIEALKRGVDVAQRRLAVLEAKMKELGQ
jgi:predicted  nucleic acid-binding Zn-ribbon protein